MRTATVHDIPLIYAEISDADRLEIAAAGSTIAAALGPEIDKGHADIWHADGDLLCVAGCVDAGDGLGRPWMVVTDAAKDHAVEGMKLARVVLTEWRSRFDSLENHVMTSNLRAVAYIGVMGFDFHDLYETPDGFEFVHFSIKGV